MLKLSLDVLLVTRSTPKVLWNIYIFVVIFDSTFFFSCEVNLIDLIQFSCF